MSDLLEDVALTILLARDTGANMSNWERQFCETLEQKVGGEYFYLSPAQKKSLFRLADKLEIEHLYDREQT